MALQTALGLSAALLLAVGVSQIIKAVSNAASQRETQKEWNALTEYCMERQDCFYLLDVTSMLSYAGNVWEPASKKNNYILTGGWMSRTPLLKERLAQMGADDGGELLVFGGTDGTEIFYIANPQRDITWLSDYLSSRFGEVELKKTDGIFIEGEELFSVYRAVLKQN